MTSEISVGMSKSTERKWYVVQMNSASLSLSLSVLLYFYRPSSQAKYFNYFLHFGLNFGVSSMVFCYATEFHARKMCVKEENFVNTFVPRFYECFIAGTD